MRRAALRAEAAHEALGEHAAQRGGEQERFNAHVNQTGDGAGGIIGVQRGEHEVAGETGLYGDLRGFQVADFANHDDIRVLPQDGAQRAGEGQPDAAVDGNLADAGQVKFHRVFDGDDVLPPRVHALQRGVERGGFAGTGGAGDQQNAVRLGEQVGETFGGGRIHA